MTARVLLVLFLLCPLTAPAMTVEEAYDAIPHNRTVFEPGYASMSQEEKAALITFFDLIDQAVKLRVELMRGQGQYADYEQIISGLESMPVPGSLTQAHSLVVAAVKEQREFLSSFAPGSNIAGDPLVQSASAKLHQAYGMLMSAYPNEAQHNKTAFFDYLCALDFL